MEVVTIEFEKLIIRIALVGSNSLVGGLCMAFLKRDYMRHIGALVPEEICFKIKDIHPEINLYDEINKVRDMFKIDEKKITVYFE